MANPADTGAFDLWITDRLTFATGKPKSAQTGDLDQWITDRITFADYVEAAAGSDFAVSVSDSVTVGESVTVRLESYINKSESITVGESVNAVVTSFVSVADGVAVSESVSIALAHQVSVSDSITVVESVALQIASFASAGEAITIGESVTLLVTSFINVTDGVAVTESVNVTIVVAGTFVVNVADSVTVTESVVLTISTAISVSDGVIVAEVIAGVVISFVAAADSVTVAESVALPLISSVGVGDSIAVTDAPAASLLISLTVGDSVSVTDSVTARVVSPGNLIILTRSIWVSYLRQSTATTVKIGPFLDTSDGVSPLTGLTLSQADIRLAKDGGNYAQKNEASASTHNENGWYSVALNTTDTGTTGRLQLSVNENGAFPVWHEFAVLSQSAYDEWMLGQDEIEFTYVLTSSQTSLPITSAMIRFATDSPGLNTVWSGTTDALGVARNLCGDKPRLQAGTVYVFRSHPNFTFSDPDVEQVS